MGKRLRKSLSIDRERLQQHIDRLEPIIRRRLFGKIRSVDRGVYDLDDVVASARRRLDRALVRQFIRPGSVSDLDAYIVRTAERVALDACKRERRQQRRMQLLYEIKPIQARPSDRSSFSVVEFLLRQLTATERGLVQLWIRGLSHRAIAEAIGVPLETERTRWRRLWIRMRHLAKYSYDD